MAQMIGLLRRLLARTPVRTFILYPLLLVAHRAIRDRRFDTPRLAGLPLLLWGYLQYRLTGNYRQQQGAGSRGMEAPPRNLIETGPYTFTRNPMYLGHLIFLLGLALSVSSWPSWVIFVSNIAWFHNRVLKDEGRLSKEFGDRYEAYCQRVKRWLPYVF